MLRPSSRTEARKKSFKKSIDADEARRKREEGMIQIRKDKREEAFLKKRRCVQIGVCGCTTRGSVAHAAHASAWVALKRHTAALAPFSPKPDYYIFRIRSSRGSFFSPAPHHHSTCRFFFLREGREGEEDLAFLSCVVLLSMLTDDASRLRRRRDGNPATTDSTALSNPAGNVVAKVRAAPHS